MSGPEEVRVQLARMEGKQDITNERLETSNKINDERHAVTKAQLAHHNERIGVLEADRPINSRKNRMGGDWLDSRRGNRRRIDEALRSLANDLLREEQARGILPEEQRLLDRLG
jgi:hypothetical protein